ncbi:MAG: hypothetical protein FJ225_04655 [Lentisphaerae bacterium]|nr:hypothetical protein [Lentisphaerota bacterium]
MRPSLKLDFALLGACCLLRCGACAETALMDGLAARVDLRAITVGDVLVAFQPLQQELRARHGVAELGDRLRQGYAGTRAELVERSLILSAYERQENKLPEWVVSERVDRIVQDMFGGDRGRFLAALAKDGLTIDEWRAQVRDHVAVTAMRSARVDRNVRVSPTQVLRAYRENAERYRRPARVKLRLIELPAPEAGGERKAARARAEGLARRAAGGEDFAALAAKESSGDKAAEGGDWGWVEPDMLRAELAAAAEALDAGGTSGVIETPEAFYIVRVADRQAAAVQPLDEVRRGIEEELRREQMDEIYGRWIAALKTKSYVRITERDIFEP